MASQTPVLSSVTFEKSCSVVEGVAVSEQLNIQKLARRQIQESLNFSEAKEVKIGFRTPLVQQLILWTKYLFHLSDTFRLLENRELIQKGLREIDEELHFQESFEKHKQFRTPKVEWLELRTNLNKLAQFLVLLEKLNLKTDGAFGLSETVNLTEHFHLKRPQSLAELVNLSEEVRLSIENPEVTEELNLSEEVGYENFRGIKEEVSLNEQIFQNDLTFGDLLQIEEAILILLRKAIQEELKISEESKVFRPKEVLENVRLLEDTSKEGGVDILEEKCNLSEIVSSNPVGASDQILLTEHLTLDVLLNQQENLVFQEDFRIPSLSLLLETASFSELVEASLEPGPQELLLISEEVPLTVIRRIQAENIMEIEIHEGWTVNEQISRIRRIDQSEQLVLKEDLSLPSEKQVARLRFGRKTRKFNVRR